MTATVTTSRKVALATALVVIAVVVGLTVFVTQLLGPSVKITDQFTGTVNIVNFDGSKGCVTADDGSQDRCGQFYKRIKLKAGDKVHVWVEIDPAFPGGDEIYLVVPQSK